MSGEGFFTRLGSDLAQPRRVPKRALQHCSPTLAALRDWISASSPGKRKDDRRRNSFTGSQRDASLSGTSVSRRQACG